MSKENHEQKSFKDIRGIPVTIRKANPKYYNETKLWADGFLVIERKDTGKIIATVHQTGLFDEIGNYFNFD
jgi:hypothetical protein